MKNIGRQLQAPQPSPNLPETPNNSLCQSVLLLHLWQIYKIVLKLPNASTYHYIFKDKKSAGKSGENIKKIKKGGKFLNS